MNEAQAVSHQTPGLEPAVLRSGGTSIQFFAFQSDQVREYWPLITPCLRAFEEKTHLATPEEVWAEIRETRAQLWAGWDGEKICGVAVTRILATARGRFCNVWIAECELADPKESLDITKQALDVIEQWARGIGCYAIEIIGRPGWERVLPGYQRTAVVLETRLATVN